MRPLEGGFASLLSTVLSALSFVAEGEVHPRWSLELGAAVAAYRSEVAFVRREQDWVAAERLRELERSAQG